VYPQFDQDCGEDFADGLGSRSPLVPDLSQFLRQRLRFLSLVRGRELDRRGVEVSQKLIRGYRMSKRELDQLFENVVSLLSARMPKGHSTRDHVKGNPAEAAAYPDSDVAGIRVLEPPSRDQDSEVLVAPDQVVSNDEDGTPKVVVGQPHQRSVGMINLVALIPRRAQAGSAGNRSRHGIILDRTHLTCEFGCRDDIDSGDTEKQNVGSLTQGFHQIALDRFDQL